MKVEMILLESTVSLLHNMIYSSMEGKIETSHARTHLEYPSLKFPLICCSHNGPKLIVRNMVHSETGDAVISNKKRNCWRNSESLTASLKGNGHMMFRD